MASRSEGPAGRKVLSKDLTWYETIAWYGTEHAP
jgi:hypothetical protein